MVMQATPEVTINFIVHADVEIFRHTLEQNVEALCADTCRRADLVMTIDAPKPDVLPALTALAREQGMNELRLRYRDRNVASGDPSNNGHVQALSDRTPYLLCIESDVAVFRASPEFDFLDAAIRFFERFPQIPLIHRMDDHDCWVKKLEKAAADIEPGVWSVNRLASHFMFYNMAAFRTVVGRPKLDEFRDAVDDWQNVEDVWSRQLAAPIGPGIAFPAGWPFRVYHCDEKQSSNSVHYRRDVDTRLKVFHQRRAEMSSIVCN